MAPRPPHFAPKARAVIHLFMNGGPSPMDLFDPKPALDRLHGKPHFNLAVILIGTPIAYRITTVP